LAGRKGTENEKNKNKNKKVEPITILMQGEQLMYRDHYLM
jgi:hypothetical protein